MIKKVQLGWTELVAYRSAVEVDTDDVIAAGYGTVDDPPNEADVAMFLSSNRDYWFEQVDGTNDVTGYVERAVISVNDAQVIP